MGVRGLSTYLHQDSRNFQDYKLHNTTLIIDAANFICQFYLKSTLYTQFNGEYVGLFALVAEFIDCLRRCMVNPIFVFDGCHQPPKLQTQLQRNKCRLQTCRALNASVNSSTKDATDPSFRIFLVPPLIMSALAEALTLLKVKFVTSDRESDHDAVSLAVHFNCPVLSDDSDFYITIPESDSGTCLLPMCYFTAKSYVSSAKCDTCIATNRLCSFISCKKFLPNGPGLNSLPFNLRPLLACLLGNDYVRPYTFSRCFPVSNERAFPPSKAAPKGMHQKRRRSLIHALVNWMRNFGDNTEEVIQRVVSRYPTSERSELTNLLNESVRTYCIDTDIVVNSFSKYLSNEIGHDVEGIPLAEDDDSDSQSSVTSEPTPSRNFDDTNSDDSSSDEESGQYNTQCIKSTPKFPSIVDQDLSPSVHIKFEERFVTSSKWPDSMIDGFRKYRIMPLFMDSVFSKASVLTCLIESLRDRKSAYSSSACIRSLIYGLILGLEDQHAPHRLSGVKLLKNQYSVTEYDRMGSRGFKSKKVFIKPIILDKTVGALDKFTQTHFGIVAYSADLEWLKWLALLVVLHHQSSPEVASNVTSSATALSLGIITICAFLNETRLKPRPKVLKKHYSRCAVLLNPAKNKLIKQQNHIKKLDIHAVHDYGELQVVYITLTSLGSLLNSLTSDGTQNSSSNCIPLPPIFVIFPSGYLFHQVYLYIKSFAPSERLVCTPSLFEKLLYSDKTCDNLPQANTLFKSYLSQLADVQNSFKFPYDMTDHTTKTEHIESANKSNESRKGSKHAHRTYKGKSEQALIEERIARLMLENGLSD